MEHLFKDAVMKDGSKTKSGSGGGTKVPHLPDGLPGRSGGELTEVLYDNIAPAPASKEPGKSMWMIK